MGGGSNVRTMSHTCLGYVTFFFFSFFFPYTSQSVQVKAERGDVGGDHHVKTVRF